MAIGHIEESPEADPETPHLEKTSMRSARHMAEGEVHNDDLALLIQEEASPSRFAMDVSSIDDDKRKVVV